MIVKKLNQTINIILFTAFLQFGVERAQNQPTITATEQKIPDLQLYNLKYKDQKIEDLYGQCLKFTQGEQIAYNENEFLSLLVFKCL